MNIEQLKGHIKSEEGEVKQNGLHVAYRDSKGYLTIGHGRLIDAKRRGGITDGEADFLFNNDLQNVIVDLDRSCPWWADLKEPAQEALAHMVFQMGLPSVLKFRDMLSCLKKGDYEGAHRDALDSKWARHDSPERAKRVAGKFLEEED